MKKILLIAFLTPLMLQAQDGIKPIIDVHVHGYTEQSYHPVPGAPSSYQEFKAAVKDVFEKYNIVAAMKSGGMYDDEMEEIMLSGYESNNYPKFDTTEFKQMIDRGEIEVWGEFMPSFNGLTLTDPVFAPYLAICEREGIPIALHTGGGPPRIFRRYKKFRLSLGDPMLIEEVLVNYPDLKVYLMHSGDVFFENALALMGMYPQVYCGLGALLWIENHPSGQYAEEFLTRAKKANLLDRVMFGSDGMFWPSNVEKSIKKLDSFEFLDEDDKRMIFYDNAVKFFDLDLN